MLLTWMHVPSAFPATAHCGRCAGARSSSLSKSGCIALWTRSARPWVANRCPRHPPAAARVSAASFAAFAMMWSDRGANRAEAPGIRNLAETGSHDHGIPAVCQAFFDAPYQSHQVNHAPQLNTVWTHKRSCETGASMLCSGAWMDAPQCPRNNETGATRNQQGGVSIAEIAVPCPSAQSRALKRNVSQMRRHVFLDLLRRVPCPSAQSRALKRACNHADVARRSQ